MSDNIPVQEYMKSGPDFKFCGSEYSDPHNLGRVGSGTDFTCANVLIQEKASVCQFSDLNVQCVLYI